MLIPDFAIRNANTLEKLEHEFHMQDMWEEAAVFYKEFTLNPPSCDCLQDELVIYYLKDRASFIRGEQKEGKPHSIEERPKHDDKGDL